MNDHLKQRMANTFQQTDTQGDRMENSVLGVADTNSRTSCDDEMIGYRYLMRELAYKNKYLTNSGIELQSVKHMAVIWYLLTRCKLVGVTIRQIGQRGYQHMFHTNMILIRKSMDALVLRGYLTRASGVRKTGGSAALFSLSASGERVVVEYLAWLRGERDEMINWD
jgi:hypothetical protein